MCDYSKWDKFTDADSDSDSEGASLFSGLNRFVQSLGPKADGGAHPWEAPADVAQDRPLRFAVGDAVLAPYLGTDDYEEAVVDNVRVDGRLDVVFLDGDFEQGLDPAVVAPKKKKKKAKTKLGGLGGAAPAKKKKKVKKR